MSRRLLLAGLLAVMCMPAPASAQDDVDVGPGFTRPGSVLVDTEVIRHDDPEPSNSEAVAAGRTTDRIARTVQCPAWPEAREERCRVTNAAGGDRRRDLTEGDVLRAVREIGLPRLSVSIQPGERTLVNADTIFSASPVPFDHSVMLLGFDVDLVATPVSYTWHHGDGTSRSTSEPGRPYPAFDITHRYRKAADVVRPSVDVTYQVRYRVDGGAWATISQTITAPGPAAELEVREAVPVLTKP